MSSADNIEVGDVAAGICCASCGIAEVDSVKLKPCDGCELVSYCGDDCQLEHRQDHEEACEERSAELRDEILFKQPEGTHHGDCPICCLPLRVGEQQSSLFSPCCSKLICKGCSYAYLLQDRGAAEPSCPFCRHPLPETTEEADMHSMKRVAANDPVALCKLGERHYDEGNYDGAFKYYTMSAELGDADAHFDLSLMYRKGQGVEKDEKKQVYHLEEAAIRGHPCARYNLGVYENMNGRFERAVKHYIIAANLGYDKSIQALKEHYKDGGVSKDDFAAALRSHHVAVNATKSPYRDLAAHVM